MEYCYRIKLLYRKKHLAPTHDFEDVITIQDEENIENTIINHAKITGKRLKAVLGLAFVDKVYENGDIEPLNSYTIHYSNGEPVLTTSETLNTTITRRK